MQQIQVKARPRLPRPTPADPPHHQQQDSADMVSRITTADDSQARRLTREGPPDEPGLFLLASTPKPLGQPCFAWASPNAPNWTICAQPPALAAQLPVVQIRRSERFGYSQAHRVSHAP